MAKNIKGEEQIKDIADKLEQLKIEFGKGLLERVKSYTPVRTGLLRNSWILKFNNSTKEIQLSNDAKTEDGREYMVYVEEGTDKMAGFFMLQRTVNDSESILAAAKNKVGL
jgi:hypothetical protein